MPWVWNGRLRGCRGLPVAPSGRTSWRLSYRSSPWRNLFLQQYFRIWTHSSVASTYGGGTTGDLQVHCWGVHVDALGILVLQQNTSRDLGTSLVGGAMPTPDIFRSVAKHLWGNEFWTTLLRESFRRGLLILGHRSEHKTQARSSIGNTQAGIGHSSQSLPEARQHQYQKSGHEHHAHHSKGGRGVACAISVHACRLDHRIPMSKGASSEWQAFKVPSWAPPGHMHPPFSACTVFLVGCVCF